MTDFDRMVRAALLPPQSIEIGEGKQLTFRKPLAIEVYKLIGEHREKYASVRETAGMSQEEIDALPEAERHRYTADGLELDFRQTVELARLCMADCPIGSELGDATIAMLYRDHEGFRSIVTGMTGVGIVQPTEDEAAEAPFASDGLTD